MSNTYITCFIMLIMYAEFSCLALAVTISSGCWIYCYYAALRKQTWHKICKKQNSPKPYIRSGLKAVYHLKIINVAIFSCTTIT